MSRASRHLVLLLASAATLAAFYLALQTPYVKWWLSLSSGYASLALLALSLVIGPWNRWRRLPNPVSSYLRRDIGIWAGILGIFHVVIALQVHFQSMWHYFLRPPEATYSFPLRIDLAGLSHYLGLFATAILVMLLALSNDASLRRLGTRRWKSLQRWNYAAVALTVLHGIIYMFLEKRSPGLVALFVALVAAAAAAQYLGYRKVRSRAP